jgi:hypothetical protein
MKREKLVRDVKREALIRMEESARTEADFNKVVKQYDHLDRNRERKERRYEVFRSSAEMLHWDKEDNSNRKGVLKSDFNYVYPKPYFHYFWRQLMKGDFIDVIHDCPYDMHEFVCDKNISELIRDLSENHMDVLYLRAIKQLNNISIGAKRRQTDRNIRKILALVIFQMQEELAPIIKEEIEDGHPDVTLEKRRFVERYYSNVVDNVKSK